jgi:hypothetical protein
MAVAGAWALTGPALGQDQNAAAPEITPPKDRWTLQFEPSVWYGAPGGKVTLPGSAAGVSPTFLDTINLDSPRPSPSAELHLYDDRWRFTFEGTWLREHDRGTIAEQGGTLGPVSFAAGDALKASESFTTVEATVAYRLTLPETLAKGREGVFACAFDVLGGMRFYDVSFDFSAPAGSTSADIFQGQPLAGVKLSVDLIEQFTVDVQVDVGGFTDGGDAVNYAYSIEAGFMWRPTPNVGAQIGYRDLAFMLRSGPEGDRFEYRGAIQGLFAGVVIRF